jgi:hemerythrin-like domain-containing protein
MTKPLEILNHEHRIIERGLHALNGMCIRLERGEQVPPEALSQFIDFIRTFADRCHHGKEETHLFPVLQQYGVPREGGPIGVMLHEHDIGRWLVTELDRAAQAYCAGDVEASRHFVEMARRYIELLTQHIQKEDHILFKIAEQVLDETALTSLAEAFEREEAELGAGTHEQYERIAAELEKAWAA